MKKNPQLTSQLMTKDWMFPPTKIRNKTRMSALPSSTQHFSGGSSQDNQAMEHPLCRGPRFNPWSGN